MAKIGALPAPRDDRLLNQMFRRVRQFLRPQVPELSPREAYRLWAETYPPYAHNLLMEVEQRAVTELLPEVRGKRVLDLASGTGRYTRLAAELGGDVIALDFSFEMLARSENHHSCAQADMLALPLPRASVDVIVCGLAVGHVANLADALREMARVLTPGGILVYSDFYAQARDWKRTFRAGDQTYAVQHHPRTQEEHAHAVRGAGMAGEMVRAVCITQELAQSDPRAASFRAHWGDTPVALVVRAYKN